MISSLAPIIAGIGPLGTPELIIIAILLAIIIGVIAVIVYALRSKK